jgi:hypothetical protein
VVKCSEVLQCSDGLSNKVPSIIKINIDNMKLLLVCTLQLSHSFIFNVYMVVFQFNTVIYVFLFFIVMSYCTFIHLFYVYVFIICLCIHCMFMYLHRASWHSSPTLTEVFRCFFLSFKANARVKPAKMGHGPHSS